ncbi:peptidylprolyl isomerase [Pseudoalteromonas byunsanensis]|uniref:peptidylprolyl isomerase n=2 Tax=Pseudoalteromonas byunsanensis TaxID=327939 RepID=A0A1S1N6R2_9GAMM|nr:peptidylprolyl isomerase [Pseudoalteromonas byunsanensis]OHU95022.1 peptidyl-prolyl cis-trans isomerase [Pseudoalteromonas byunsanensis]
MSIYRYLVSGVLVLSALQVHANASKAPHEIVAQASESAWRTVNIENVLKIQLATGAVYVELNPFLAPMHVDNIKLLARERFYDGLNVYRFVEGFVAQGGDETSQKQPLKAKRQLPAEFIHKSKTPLSITALNMTDGYAERTGFLNSFAVAQNASGTHTWQTHCTGAFAMAREDAPNSGGTEFYIALTPQRYLDQNTTVFGQVLQGMEHIQRLDRTAQSGKVFNPITSVEVLADVSKEDKLRFKVFDTNTKDFKALIEARKNRPEAWFVAKPNYADVCAIKVPVRSFTGD